VRARKRLDFAKALIREIGMADDCFELVLAKSPGPISIDEVARALLT
jgi:hypothetical protein